jgi:acetolactate synthase regulatory subunit
MSAQRGRAETAQTPKTFTACFSVVAVCDPHTLSRILQPFTKRGLTPSHVYAMRTGERADAMHVDLHLTDADADTAWRLANDLRGLHLVQTVLTSEKRLADAT